MERTNILVFTDNVCNDFKVRNMFSNKTFNKINNSLKETKQIKKAGLPTLVIKKSKKSKKEAFKKVGQSTLVINISVIPLIASTLKALCLLLTAYPSSQATCPPPPPTCQAYPAWPTCVCLPCTACPPSQAACTLRPWPPTPPPCQTFSYWSPWMWLPYPTCPTFKATCALQSPPPPPPYTSRTCPTLPRHAGARWNYQGISNNKLLKMINGNRRLGYNLGMWNCRRGLVTGDREASSKIVDVKNFLHKKKLHMLCLVEADLHSETSRYKRVNPLTSKDIHEGLHIPGYRIFLPKTWNKHGQARILVYAKDELQVKEWVTGDQTSDLPSISFLISLGKERKTVVNFFYREFTGGVSGLKDLPAQNERLARQTAHWRNLNKSNKDIVCLGDANLCALKWYDEDYSKREQAETVQSFLIDTASTQVIKQYTRSEIIQGGEVSRSCIDHCYTNVAEKLSKPEVIAVGESDHLGIVVTKYARVPVLKPRTITKRSYKNFSIEAFLTEVLNSSINKDVTSCNTIDEAAEVFEKSFKQILDHHAPIKTFQMRKHYSPYVSDRTKLLMMERNSLKEEAVTHGDKHAEKESKKIGKQIKKALADDEKQYFKKILVKTWIVLQPGEQLKLFLE